MQLRVAKANRILTGMLGVSMAPVLLSGCGSSQQLTQVVTPTFSPAGGSYSSVQQVSIVSPTPGAAIYYTCYGPGLSSPCVDTNATGAVLPPVQQGAFLGAPYTGPITVTGNETISAIATYSDAPFSTAATASYTVPLAPPTFSLAQGSYTSYQTVTMTDALASAVIYYTTNGTTPTTTSSRYTSPITISASETVNAIAVQTGYANSGVTTATYAINLPTAATPSISPVTGTYTSIQTVSITDATPGVAIYYTTNGNTPTTASTPYTAPFQVTTSETVNAIATATGSYLPSAVATAVYTLNLPPAPTPTFAPVAGTYTSIQSVTLSDTAAGASIYYTTNGTTPTISSTPYTGPITVGVSETLNAVAIAAGYSVSNVGSAAYTINLPPAPTPTFSPAPGTYTAAQSVTLSDTAAGASIYYTVNGTTPTTASTPYTGAIAVSGTETIEAIATAPGYSSSAVGSALYTINLPAAPAPTFLPVAGTYTGAQSVTLSDTASSPTFYYTLDGSTPTSTSTLYTGPISVTASETISAIASATGYSYSPVATAAYTIVYNLSGTVLAGTQAVSGSTVQVYAAGTGGYGLGSAAISTAAVTTNASGQFTVQYSCPTPTSQIYVVATGGNPGLTTGTNNAYLTEMAALGTCSTITAANPAVTVTLNEVTTVASVWALQQFMASPTVNTTQGVPMIGAPATSYGGVQTGVIGLQNAFGMVKNLVNVTTGSAAAPPNTWATPETTKINSLANTLYSCDSTNPSAPSTACSTLMTDATPSTKTTAIDTVQAAWYMGQNPSNNVTNLYHLGSTLATPPFTGLTATPNDWTLAVNLAPQYTPASTALYAVNTPHHVAIDRYGNVWLSNITGTSGVSATYAAPSAGVVELAPNGSVIMTPVSSFTASTTGGTYSQFVTHPSSTTVSFSEPRMVAVDTNNNVWVANYNGAAGTPAAGSVGFFNGSTGAGVGGSVGTGYFVGASPWGIAIDGSNNVYVSNTGNTGMDPLSVGKFAGGTGVYTYSTSGGASAPNELPNVKAVVGGSGGFNYYGIGSWSAVLAVDTNTAASGGTDGILWTASPSCVTTSSLYDNTANIAWGVVDMFDADTLSPLSGSEATTSYSGASVGAGSSTNCGSTATGTTGDVALAGTGLAINQVFTAAMASPYGLAIDKSNGVWIADASYSSYSPGFNGLTYLAAPTTSTGTIPASTFIVNQSNPSSYAFNPTGTPNQGQVQRESTYIEVDGNNDVWVANQGFNTVAEASVSYNATTSAYTITYLTPSSGQGFYHATLSSAYGLAIDPSGNVWLTNTNTTATYTGQSGGPATPYVGASMTVLVGAAGPVVTPLSQAVKSNRLGQKP